jgi:hypothetical protein
MGQTNSPSSIKSSYTLTSKAPRYTYSILQFGLSLLALLGLLGIAGLVLVFSFLSALALPGASGTAVQAQLLPMSMIAVGLATCAVLLIPSVYYALLRISGRPASQFPKLPRFLRPTILILTLPLVLLLGYWVSGNAGLSWLLLPILQILAIGLPALWLTYLAMRGLPLGSPQRLSGVLGSGLTLGPLLILSLETIALVFFGVIGFFYISNQPEMVEQLNRLAQLFQQGAGSEEELLQAFLPWLVKPSVIFFILAFAAVIVPLIEEAIKPIGVWLLAGFKLSPAAGFAAGALCGAGFAFFESLALTATGADWAASSVARIGTSVIHITNSGLMGWAIALAWRERRYFNLALTYLTVVLVHGVWNGLAIINLVDQVLVSQGMTGALPGWSGLASWLGSSAPYILFGASLVMFAILLWMNARMRRSLPLAETPAQPVTLETETLI